MKSIGLWFVLTLAGCAPAALTELDASHPASPKAAEAPPVEGFQALAPRPSAPDVAGGTSAQPAGAPETGVASGGEPEASQAHSHRSHRHDR